jgi:AcrR family transcriptional regulator
VAKEQVDGTPAQRPTGERAERSRRAIVHAARRCFIRDGFVAGMDQIAAEAKVSKVTVYNHFGSKEALFLDVVTDALEQALAQAVAGTEHLAESTDLRVSLIHTAREWVTAMTAPDVVELRRLVTAEVRQFPELGEAWQRHGPGDSYDAMSAAFDQLIAQGRLVIPDVEVAIIQFQALVLYPHLVYSTYGRSLSPEITEGLITQGVEMFLTHYRYRPARTSRTAGGRPKPQRRPAS